MALPELPDDRRAAPRRFSGVGQQFPVNPPSPGEQYPVPDRRVAPPGVRRDPDRNGNPVRPPAPSSPDRLEPRAPVAGNGHRANPPSGIARAVDRAAPPGLGADDEPTIADGLPRVEDVVDDSAAPLGSAETPGRHRRRAGGSPAGAAAKAEKDASSPRARQGRRRSSFWKELPLLVVVALVLTFLIQTFLAKVYVIPSGSMETTLHGCVGCNNDRVLVDKITYRFSDPAPGDVVVFRGPDSWSSEVIVEQPNNALVRGLQLLGSLVGLAPPDEKDFVKRVIAVGGQTVQCCDSDNRVVVDGKPLTEPYIYYLPEAGPGRQNAFGPVVVPAGELWMMGDSRNNSADSRVADHGPVPVANVIGKARLIVLPFTRLGWIDSVDPQPTASGSSGAGTEAPLAVGLLGVLPLALGRRRAWRREADLDCFLPAGAWDPSRN